MRYKSLLWTFPFIGFALGYALASYFFAASKLPTPCIVGLQLSQATKVLSDQQLNLRMVGCKIDSTIKPETIITQQPTAGLPIKAHQTVFVVIAQQPADPQTPHLLGMPKQQAEELLTKQGLSCKCYTLPCAAPIGTIIAQDPAPESSLSKSIVLYYAMSYESLVILPRLVGRPLAQVADFLTRHHLPFNAVYPDGMTSSNNQCIIREQRPLAGSLIDSHTPPTVQLLVEESSAPAPDTLPHTPAQTEAVPVNAAAPAASAF